MNPKADFPPTGTIPLMVSLIVPSPPMQMMSWPFLAAISAKCVASPGFSVSFMVMSSNRFDSTECSKGMYLGARSRPEVGLTMTVHCPDFSINLLSRMTAVPIPQFVDLMLIISNHHGLLIQTFYKRSFPGSKMQGQIWIVLLKI